MPSLDDTATRRLKDQKGKGEGPMGRRRAGGLMLWVVVVLALMAPISLAEESDRWHQITKGTDGAVLYIDLRSIAVKDDITKVWLKRVDGEDEDSYLLSSMEVRCDQSTSRLLEFALHRKDGTYEIGRLDNEDWESVPEVIYELVCTAGMIPATAQTSPAQEYFTDVVLINQHGQEMGLYSDVLKGHVVVINTFFTTCEGACPILTGKLAKLQERLGDQLENEILLISITVDPITDTPARLKAYAEKFNARPGWIFLTGQKENVDFALSKLGQYVEDKDAHSSIVLVGNEPTGLWKKVYGLGTLEDLIQAVEAVLND